jgi:mitochondrial fission protein ELM1
LRICVLSDGHPGHYNQSRGIVRALRSIRPVEECWIDAQLRFGLARNLLRGYLNRGRSPASLWPLRVFYRLRGWPGAGCDLIVSAGGRTAFANAWLAAVLRVPNLYAGSLRGLSAQRFSVVLTLEAVQGAASNLVVPVPPSAIDDQRVEREGAEFRARLNGQGERYWTLLVGGDGAGYRYAQDDWRRLARLADTLAARYGVRWLLVSSRRTGRRAEALLKQHIEARHVAAACWYGAGDGYQPEAWLGAAERVFITEDSMTMLAEAIHARRPVHSLRPVCAAPGARYERALQGFVAGGMLCRHGVAELLRQPGLPDARQCHAPGAAPNRWLAEQLRQRLGLT